MRFLAIALGIFLGFQAICYGSPLRARQGVGKSGPTSPRLLVILRMSNANQTRLDIPSRRLIKISRVIIGKERVVRYQIDEAVVSQEDVSQVVQLASSAKKRLIGLRPRSLWLGDSPADAVGCLTVKWEDSQAYAFGANPRMLELAPKHVRDAYRDVWEIERSIEDLMEKYSCTTKRTLVYPGDPVVKRYKKEMDSAYRKSRPRGYVGRDGKRYPVS